MQAAAALLEENALDQISLKDIAKYAGIPVGSAYHFYSNATDVFTALAQRFMVTLNDAIGAPFSGSAIGSWQSLFAEAIDRAVKIYNENPAYRQLIIGAKAPPEIKLADRANDERVGELFEEVLSRYFEFPHFPNHKDVFFYATEAVDLMLSLSVIRYGAITEEMVSEAKKMGTAYLRTYMPEELPRKRPRSIQAE
ncbi:MAG: TetR family transcriptional regulator [Pseudomonadales bacterium]